MKSKYLFYLFFLVVIHFEVGRLIGSMHPPEESDDASNQQKAARFEYKELPALTIHRYSPYLVRYNHVKKHAGKRHVKNHHQNKVYW